MRKCPMTPSELSSGPASSACDQSLVMSGQATLLDLVQDATSGFDKLLNNDLAGAKATFEARPESVPHSVGAGISTFLQAALGQEDTELYGALDVLVKAEAQAATQAASKRGTGASGQGSTAYAPGLEYKVRLMRKLAISRLSEAAGNMLPFGLA